MPGVIHGLAPRFGLDIIGDSILHTSIFTKTKTFGRELTALDTI